VDTGRTWRGGQRQLLLLARGLRDQGIEPLVVSPPASLLLHRLKTEGLASASFPMRSVLDLLAIRRLRRLLATWRPHLVHAHDTRAHALLDAALLGRRRRATFLVVTQRATTIARRTIRSRARVARFVAISSVVRDALIAAGVTDDRVTVVYPGVAPAATGPGRDWRTECDWPHTLVVAGVVGPLTDVRHQGALDALVARLPERERDRLALVLLGGPAAGRATMQGTRVMRAGFVHDMQQALAGLDLLLHPGDAEGLGTAVIEAMAAGVPTVAYNTGGIAEIVAHERNGLLVAPGDADGFAAATARLVDDADLRATLAAAGPARAREFDDAHMVAATLAIYRDLIERSAV
jgi:glycosyltransferase involved in cell wall biosynthesis